MKEKGWTQLQTGILGGVDVPCPEDLAAMQKGSYILHARGGKLTKVPAEKNLLPHDPQGHVQAVSTALAPDGTAYVNQPTLMCKSTDGGYTWTSHEHQENMGGAFEVFGDGTFISVAGSGETAEPLTVLVSRDEGRTWQAFSRIEVPQEFHARYIYTLFRLSDDTLLCGVSASNMKSLEDDWTKWVSGKTTLLLFRSTDKGRSWQGPITVADWGSEGGIARTASGKLLAVIRHQRPLLPDDPLDVLEKTGASVFDSTFPYKHIFLADSEDEGRTWKGFRQLTTVFGQCYGFPAALSDGTVAVVHDHRYPRGLPGRAMISRDEGVTWEDEVYSIYYGAAISGYSESVVLEGDVILTIAGTTENMTARELWDGATGRSALTAIRWKPEKE
jgi:hypothetical protein